MVQLCKEREELAHKKERPDVKYIYSKKEEIYYLHCMVTKKIYK